jgi:prepilin-type N-terminal cleavage/methylation domain-containing protein
MRGFTLVEIMVTVAIFCILVALGLFMSMEAYRGATYRSERDTIVSLLQRARSRAMANIEQSKWSVCYEDPNYLIAKGSICNDTTARDRVEANASVVAASTLTDFPIVFEQVTGNVTSAPDTLKIVQGNRADDITINHEGTINW